MYYLNFLPYSVHFGTIPYAAGSKQGVNLQQLTTLVRNADISDSELQILIDVLLTMQQEGPASKHDWSEVIQCHDIETFHVV